MLFLGNEQQEFPEYERLIQYCPVCEYSYDRAPSVILEEDVQARVVHMECPNCQHRIIAFLLERSTDIPSVALLTELSSDEMAALRETDHVVEDDVLEIHEALQSPLFLEKYFHHSMDEARDE